MKENHIRRSAFTLIELLTILAVISILGCLLMPAMARTRTKSHDTGCLSGMRQMMAGWAMYKDENNDFLLPNAPGGVAGWVQKTENWQNAIGNTDPQIYLSALLARYVNNHIECYRCPADVIPSDNGIRLRSRSMNSQVGVTDTTAISYNPGWQNYLKSSDLTCLAPKDTFIFCDESMYSMNDGFLQSDLNAPDYPDVPANYHDGGCGFSFADGHAEIHKWLWVGPASQGLLNAPYTYGVVNNGTHWVGSAQDVDWQWLKTHSACHK